MKMTGNPFIDISCIILSILITYLLDKYFLKMGDDKK
jgi:hypothetical protein